MATGVGLRIAEDECIAAIVTGDGDLGGATGTVPDVHYLVRESILHMSEDGDSTLGGDPPAGTTHSIAGFAASVGDPAGIRIDDGEAYRAEDLVATALFCLIDLTADHLSGPAEFYATHPAHWPDSHIRALREALDYLGLRSVVLVDETGLPAADTVDTGRSLAQDTGRSFAHSAARAALTAVLATPAGLAPPDPTESENATEVTIVLPALKSAEPVTHAYSAAIAIAEPPTESAPPTEPPATTDPAGIQRRTVVLIATAAVIGLVLGGIGVALFFRDRGPTTVSPLRDAHPEPVPSTAPPPPPPVVLPIEPTTTLPIEPFTEPPVVYTTEPPIVYTTEPPVTPTTQPPATTPPTTTEPRRITITSSARPTPTSRTPNTTFRIPIPTWQQLPPVPDYPWMPAPR